MSPPSEHLSNTYVLFSQGCTDADPCVQSPALCSSGTAAGTDARWVCPFDLPRNSAPNGGGLLCYTDEAACAEGPNSWRACGCEMLTVLTHFPRSCPPNGGADSSFLLPPLTPATHHTHTTATARATPPAAPRRPASAAAASPRPAASAPATCDILGSAARTWAPTLCPRAAGCCATRTETSAREVSKRALLRL